MKAAWYSKNGKARDVLEVGELPTPEPGPDDVRVRLAVSGVNPSDVKSRGGSRPVKSGFVVPHSDGSGIIDKVGSNVSPSRIGERVWVWNGQWLRAMGTAAEYIALPSNQAVLLPDHIDFDAGACLGIPALTAFHAIELAGNIRNKTVLVIGVGSSVGYYAAQMAKLKGARVIGTVGSADRARLATDLGIDDIVDYKKDNVATRILSLTANRGVDIVVDMDFSSTTHLVSQNAVAEHGAVVCYGSNVRGQIPIDFGAWLFKSIRLHFFLIYDLLPGERLSAVEGLSQLLESGRLVHNIGPRYTLDEIADAHEAVERGSVAGNVVLDCARRLHNE